MEEMTVKTILDWVKAKGIMLEWHSYPAVPGVHCFATWNIPEKKFSGADLVAYFKSYPLEITFFYREQKKQPDFNLEFEFENDMRPMGEYTSTTGYDNTNKLFFTQYRFEFMTPIECED